MSYSQQARSKRCAFSLCTPGCSIVGSMQINFSGGHLSFSLLSSKCQKQLGDQFHALSLLDVGGERNPLWKPIKRKELRSLKTKEKGEARKHMECLLLHSDQVLYITANSVLDWQPDSLNGTGELFLQHPGHTAAHLDPYLRMLLDPTGRTMII